MRPMRNWGVLLAVCGGLLLAVPARAAYEPAAEDIVEGMTIKLIRGIVNVVTCPGEIPRQICRKVQTRGGFTGSVVGFCTGLGMTVYRGIAGVVEAGLFLVPEPDFYGPIAEPPYVWNEWLVLPKDLPAELDAAPAPEPAPAPIPEPAR